MILLLLSIWVGFSLLIYAHRFWRKRQQRRAAAAQPGADPAFNLDELTAMRDAGTITPEEFERLAQNFKARISSCGE